MLGGHSLNLVYAVNLDGSFLFVSLLQREHFKERNLKC